MRPFSFLFVLLLLAGPAWAEDGEPADVMTGKVLFKMASDYAKPCVNGDEFESHEYEDDGKTLLLLEMRRDVEVSVRLVPMYPDLAPFEMTIGTKDWKLETVGRNVKEWQVRKTVRFDKAKVSAPPKRSAPAEEEAPPPPPPTAEEKAEAGEQFLMGTPAPKAPVKK